MRLTRKFYKDRHRGLPSSHVTVRHSVRSPGGARGAGIQINFWEHGQSIEGEQALYMTADEALVLAAEIMQLVAQQVLARSREEGKAL